LKNSYYPPQVENTPSESLDTQGLWDTVIHLLGSSYNLSEIETDLLEVSFEVEYRKGQVILKPSKNFTPIAVKVLKENLSAVADIIRIETNGQYSLSLSPQLEKYFLPPEELWKKFLNAVPPQVREYLKEFVSEVEVEEGVLILHSHTKPLLGKTMELFRDEINSACRQTGVKLKY